MKKLKDQFDNLIDGIIDVIRVQEPAGCSADRLPTTVFPGSFNPLHDGHRKMAALASRTAPLWFEISVTNVEKSSLAWEDVEKRLANKFEVDYGVLLTNAPTFEEKVSLFPMANFVVGADTIERISDLKFYQSETHRERVFDLFETKEDQSEPQKKRFIVFGRWNGQEFVSDQVKIGARLRKMCRFISQSEFDERISSTEIREQKSD